MGAAHANSICVFSGLEDGDGAAVRPVPAERRPRTGATSASSSPASCGLTPAQIKASGEQPGDACNGTEASWPAAASEP